MPRPNYGPEAKKRAQSLLAALLAFANDELDCDEAALDRLRPQIQAHWQNERRLVIRTKVRFLEVLTQLAVTPLTAEQIKESLKRLEDFAGVLEDNRPSRSGSEIWHFTLNLWHGRNEQPANLKRFEAAWEAQRSQKSQAAAPSEPPEDHWLILCQTSLQAQQCERLTTNPLTVDDGVTFALEQLYLPLALTERRQQERREQEISPTSGSQLYDAEAAETSECVPVENFLESLLQADQPQRLAIIGEPGAGKTTLLQKTAAWLLTQKKLPIWISLADLQGATFEYYLLNDWLKAAMRKVTVPPEMQMALGEQFNQGRVWLLLDAVDEMAMEPSAALALIARQLRGWISDAHIILTCRSNVWDAGKNTLENFVIYRNTGLSEVENTDQISLFVQRWFVAKPELGASLKAELTQRHRIRDMVRNPLRLALLCRAWSMAQGRLPNTKTALYQQFVAAIYRWKQERFPTTLRQRQQLSSALAQLALKALMQDEIKFRLRQSFVEQAFGVESSELLELALQLGWLNQVGIANTEKGSEIIYAFYHPTFQEYFAAQAIADWRWFTDSFAIFSPQWRQPILLWLGRAEVTPTDKEALVAALTQFEDGCGGFYGHQAYLLAAAGLAEFSESSQATAIIQQMIRWRFGEFDPLRETWRTYPQPLQEAARVALLQTDRQSAIAGLEQFLTTSRSPFARWTAAYSLGKTLDPGNQIAVRTLTELLGTLRQDLFQIQLSEGLAKINPGNETAIATLVALATTLEQDSLRRKAAYSLAKLVPGNQTAMITLIQLSQSASDQAVKKQAAENLRQLESGDDASPQTTAPRRKIQAAFLGETIARLEKRLEAAQNAESQRRFAYQLGILQPGHPQAVETLLALLLAQHSPRFYKRTADYLQAVLLPEQLAQVIAKLRPQAEVTASGERSEQALESYKLLWHCAQKLPYADFRQAWMIDAVCE